MKPSRAQLRLVEYQAMDKELKEHLLGAISDALDTRIGRKIVLSRPEWDITVNDQGISALDMNNDELIPWDELSTSRLLTIYTEIVKTLSL